MFRNIDIGACNICGHKKFRTGPNGRLSPTRKPPCCVNCRSLERHRAIRFAYDCLPSGFLSWRRALQFSRDTSMREQWYRSFEVSQYEKENSIDVQKIDRTDASYDYLILNHVLEAVPDAKASFKELIRILSDEGVMQISFSKPLSREKTIDYDKPYSVDLFFHAFGRDLLSYFGTEGLGVGCFVDPMIDPVTRTRQSVHFFSRSPRQLELLEAYSRLRGEVVAPEVTALEQTGLEKAIATGSP